MLEILSFVFGGLFRLAPKLLEYQEKKLDREHERDMVKLNMELDAKRAELQMQQAEKAGEIQQQIAELAALIEVNKAQMQARPLTGNRWLDWLTVLADAASSFVRPILTYWYCVVAYGSYKTASYWMLLEQETPWKEAIVQLWTPNDHAVMFSIIGFWFVDRALRKREGS